MDSSVILGGLFLAAQKNSTAVRTHSIHNAVLVGFKFQMPVSVVVRHDDHHDENSAHEAKPLPDSDHAGC